MSMRLGTSRTLFRRAKLRRVLHPVVEAAHQAIVGRAVEQGALDPAAYQPGAGSPEALAGWIGGTDLELARYVLRPGRRRAAIDGLEQFLVAVDEALHDHRNPARHSLP